jgi:2-methylcitrate dehydratase
MDAIAGPFQIDWSEEDLERVTRTVTKRYNAEVHSQSVIEAVLELREQAPIDPADIDRVEVAVFDVAYHIIGGGEEGEKMSVLTKEDADHSIPYLVAVALLDGQVLPAQFESERILRPDVQRLLRKVDVRPDDELSRRFPDHHSCRVRIHPQAGPVLAREKQDYAGDTARPASWEDILEKFDLLAVPVAGRGLAGRIANAVRRLADDLPVVELMQQLARVPSVPSS